MAPRILIFSIATGANYSFYVKTIETHACAFLKLNILAIGRVFNLSNDKMQIFPTVLWFCAELCDAAFEPLPRPLWWYSDIVDREPSRNLLAEFCLCDVFWALIWVTKVCSNWIILSYVKILKVINMTNGRMIWKIKNKYSDIVDLSY